MRNYFKINEKATFLLGKPTPDIAKWEYGGDHFADASQLEFASK